jgi:predicted DNA binding CopG/RHH family protein
MHTYDLDIDEVEQSTAIDMGEFTSVKNLAERKAQLVSAAGNHLNKAANVNIRLPQRDLYKLKAKALEEGLPYQTMIGSILHKAVA